MALVGVLAGSLLVRRNSAWSTLSSAAGILLVTLPFVLGVGLGVALVGWGGILMLVDQNRTQSLLELAQVHWREFVMITLAAPPIAYFGIAIMVRKIKGGSPIAEDDQES
jgi:hypothetical protein